MIVEYFNMALDMMSNALSNPHIKNFPIPQKLNNNQNNYFQIIQNYNSLNKLLQNESLYVEQKSNKIFSKNPSLSISVSFRDVIEKYCQEHFIEFKQKINFKTGEIMSTIDGKSLWEFNGILCYIDNNVLYAKEDSSSSSSNRIQPKWVPITLDDLYHLSLAKK